MKNIPATKISNFFVKKFKELGVKDNVAKDTVNALVSASLFGIDSHGINLIKHYYDCILGGRVEKDFKVDLTVNKSGVLCNANHGFAHHAARILLQKMDKVSSNTGISIGTIINSDHMGAIGIHAVNSKIKNKIIISFTNADALACSPDGRDVVFGTNPISLVYKSDITFLYIDLATTTFSKNKVKNFRREDKSLPNNVARDINMNITNDPHDAEYLEPIGGHKGFALAYLVEILTSGLSGQSHSRNLLAMYNTDLSIKRNVSHSFLMIDPAIFGISDISLVEEAIKITNGSVNSDQKDLLPGNKELITQKERLKKGIPVMDEVVEDWSNIGFKTL